MQMLKGHRGIIWGLHVRICDIEIVKKYARSSLLKDVSNENKIIEGSRWRRMTLGTALPPQKKIR